MDKGEQEITKRKLCEYMADKALFDVLTAYLQLLVDDEISKIGQFTRADHATRSQRLIEIDNKAAAYNKIVGDLQAWRGQATKEE